MLWRGLDALKTYWIVAVIGVVIIGMFLYMSSQDKVLLKLESDVITTKELITDAEATRTKLETVFNAKEHQEKIKERTVSAKEIGREMIAVDDALTAFYKTNEPLPTDKKEKDTVFKALEKTKQKNSILTGAKDSDHINTWQLNPEWTLTLESVVTYQDTDKVPVVFSMKTKAGKAAGLVYAIYDVNKHKLTNISRHYTTDGLQDEIDVGGV